MIHVLFRSFLDPFLSNEKKNWSRHQSVTTWGQCTRPTLVSGS